jgi:hypothetical protein
LGSNGPAKAFGDFGFRVAPCFLRRCGNPESDFGDIVDLGTGDEFGRSSGHGTSSWRLKGDGWLMGTGLEKGLQVYNAKCSDREGDDGENADADVFQVLAFFAAVDDRFEGLHDILLSECGKKIL